MKVNSVLQGSDAVWYTLIVFVSCSQFYSLYQLLLLLLLHGNQSHKYNKWSVLECISVRPLFLVSESIFPIGILAMKPWTKLTSFEENHNHLKQKSIWKSDKKTTLQDCVLNSFSEGRNYNPVKHCKWH